jgi:hypothetical protein
MNCRLLSASIIFCAHRRTAVPEAVTAPQLEVQGPPGLEASGYRTAVALTELTVTADAL